MLTKMYVKSQNWIASDEGATAVEYGLMVALIAIIIIGAVAAIGTNLSTVFNDIAGKLVGLGS